nr:PREDICTED: 11-beta-hydroxysteroid dehydrogenase 1B-like [Daucus carota subsp. sativus]
MELINSFLNLVAPPFAFITLLLFLPPYALFKYLFYVLRSFLSENVAGKVVLITGASSGIGEHLAYEYGSQGACLALTARREDRLQQVAQVARELGAPDVIVIAADVSRIDDCQRMVDQTINHFGKLDHLVNNAGIVSVCMFEEVDDMAAFRSVMEINFWGPVYMTRFALPHLRKSNGKVIVISSANCWFPMPRSSFYNASKAAVTQLFETLRIEFGSEIKVTLVTPGFVESEMTQGKGLFKGGQLQVDQDLVKAQVGLTPVISVVGCSKAIVKSACRGDRNLVEPAWIRITRWLKLICPEILDMVLWLCYISKPGASAHESFNKWTADLIKRT